MKRILVITMAIICSGVFSSIVAKPKGKMTKKETQVNRYEISIPCMEESYDSMDEIRGFGFADGMTVELAKNEAIRHAIDDIINKMPRRIKSMTSPSADGSSSETIVENTPMITEEQRQALNKFEIICLKSFITPEGMYEVYVVIRVLTNMDNIEFDEKLHLKTPNKEELRKLFEENEKNNQ